MNSSTANASAPTVDPVCGMPAGEGDPSHTHDGKTYYFCSELCRQQFMRDPGVYVQEDTEEEYGYGRAFWSFWLAIAAAVLSNVVGLFVTYTYISIVFGSRMLSRYLRETALFPLLLSIFLGFVGVYWFLNPLLRYFSPFRDKSESPDASDTLRRNALNTPIILSGIAYALWLVFGSVASLVLAEGGIQNKWRWFFHVWGSNFFAGTVVALSIFYVSERLMARYVVPRVMEGKQVSELEGVIPVPIWFRISMLIMTSAILPMTHVFALKWLGDTDTNLILFFIGMIIAVAVFQSFYILRSISLPIGRIADKFEKFQKGESLPRHQSLYRADDLGRFAEMFEDLIGTIQERDFLQMTFGRYMSQQVMEQIINGQVELGGEKRNATVLFTDVRDFTSLAEEREPEEIVQLLNDYFERMVKAITNTDGIPDKFIGDGLMAVWGVPIQVDNHQQRAVEGAFKMFNELKTFNEERLERGEEPIRIGTAIHSGELIAGNIGSNKKMEFTVIGDTVNTCSRIESMNKKFDTDLTVSQSVYQALSESFQEKFERKPEVEIRGKSEPVTIYTLTEAAAVQGIT